MLILNSPCTVGSCPSFPKASQYFGGTACSPTAAQLFLPSLPSTDGSGLELSLEQNHVEIPSSQGCFLGTIWEPGRSQETLLLSYTQFIHQFLHCKNWSSPLLLCTIDNIGTSYSCPGSVVLSMSQITTGALEKKYIRNLNDSIFYFVSTMGEEEDFLCKTSSVQQTCMLFCLFAKCFC